MHGARVVCSKALSIHWAAKPVGRTMLKAVPSQNNFRMVPRKPILMMGQGASASIKQQIASLGNNMLYVWSGSQNQGGMRGGSGTVATLVAEDVDAIERECTAVKEASPGVQASGQLVFGNQNWSPSGRITGTNEKFPSIRAWPVASGEFFTDADVKTAARVCVLGKTVADNLFEGADPVVV